MTRTIEDVKKQAALVFGDPEKADEWLSSSLSVLHGRTPYSVICTDEGIQEVLRILNKIADGFP